ncbi:MAG: hypothetical protein HN914_04620, partial [Candidatus Marinimicrobia bacterium]|nr:hypothetical protein [Candidatus Neomarinimicrobiota bacterium]
ALNPTRTVIEKALDKFTPQTDAENEEALSVKRSIAVGLNPLKYFSQRRPRKAKK